MKRLSYVILFVFLILNSCQNDNYSIDKNQNKLNKAKVIGVKDKYGNNKLIDNELSFKNNEANSSGTVINYVLDNLKTHSLALERTKESLFFKSYETTWVDNKFVETFINSLLIDISNQTVYAFTMYGKASIKNTTSILVDDISAIGIYTIDKKGQLIFSLYRNMNGSFKEESSTNIKAKTLNSRDVLFVYDKYFDSHDNSNNSFVVFRNITTNSIYDSSLSKDEFLLFEAAHYAQRISESKDIGAINNYLKLMGSCGPGCIE